MKQYITINKKYHNESTASERLVCACACVCACVCVCVWGGGGRKLAYGIPILSVLSLWNGLFYHWIWICLLSQIGMSVKNHNTIANSVAPDENMSRLIRIYTVCISTWFALRDWTS